jgi:tetratricopeptide (TPR) repeat protein
MNPRDLIPTADQIKAVQGIEADLLQRRRKGKIGLLVGVAGALLQVVIAVAAKENLITNLGNLLVGLRQFHWSQLAAPQAIGIYAIFLGFGAYFILRRTSFLAKESQEPFQYTFWIEKFEDASPTATQPQAREADKRISLLHHDLMERLNERIPRFSLLDEKNPGASPAQTERMNSHIHISGHYAIREIKDEKLVVHVMPRIRIGPVGKPATLAHPVKYQVWSEYKLSAYRYNQIVERVYSSIATEVYKQIESDVKEKMDLFPTNYLRAVALFHEAEDFAKSNTIDAYDSAIRLYQESLRFLSIAITKRITRFLLKVPMLWQLRVDSEHMEASVQIGYAKCQIFRRQISALTGRSTKPLYEIVGNLEGVLKSLKELHTKMGTFRERKRSNFVMAFLTFPKDSLLRRLSLRPLQPLFEKQRRILFDANVVAALAFYNLDAVKEAEDYLKDARAVDPPFSQRNALYFLAAAEIEPDLEKAMLLFRQATDMDPDFQIAQHRLAVSSQMRFRAKGELVEARAKSVIEEYDKVLMINPGNVAALAAQGYVYWLLADPDHKDKKEYLRKAKEKFEEGSEIKAIVRETFIGELNYGLARIAAAEGNYEESYDLFTLALESDPGIGVWSVAASTRPVTSYYDYITPSMLQRYEKFVNEVEKSRKEQQRVHDGKARVSESSLKAVYSFVLNDYGNACFNYYFRLGDFNRLETAVEQFEKAVAENPDNMLAQYNLAVAYSWNPDTEAKALSGFEEISLKVPTWQDVVIRYGQSLIKVPREGLVKVRGEIERVTAEIQDAVHKAAEKKKDVDKVAEEIRELEQARSVFAHKYVNSLLFQGLGPLKLVAPGAGAAEAATPDYLPAGKWIQSQNESLNKLKEKLKEVETEKANKEQEKSGLKRSEAELVEAFSTKAKKAIRNIMENSKLSSLFVDSATDYQGDDVDQLLCNEAIRWDRLDEGDVLALRAWAEILSNYDQQQIALTASIKICYHILSKFERNSFEVNLILQDALERVRQLNKSLVPDERMNQVKEILKAIVERWVEQDPVHYALLGWYQTYFAEDEYRERIDQALRMIGDDSDYRKALVSPYQLQMGVYLEKEAFDEASKQLEVALKIGPKDAGYYSDLALAWESFKGTGQRIAALDQAARCLRKAAELEPAQADYQQRLERIETAKLAAKHFGEKTLDERPTTAPIVVEIASNLAGDVASEAGQLLEHVGNQLMTLREHYTRTIGVSLPGVNFRDSGGSLVDGRYVILINETPVGDGIIPKEERLFPGPAKDLLALGVQATETTNPQTGNQAAWVRLEYLKAVEEAGYRLWENSEYIVHHLETVLINHLAEFLGQQEVRWILERESTRTGKELSVSSDKVSALTSVLRRLVDERVPIIALDAIVTNFIELTKARKNVPAIVEATRSLPEVRSTLPGNNDGYSFYFVGQNLEAEIRKGVGAGNAHPTLALTPENYRRAMDPIRNKLTSQPNVVLLAESATLRPFVRKLIEVEFPQVPVLSREELVHGLESKIVGEVELQ